MVSAINDHRFHVFPPTQKEVDEWWNITRLALWTTTNLDGKNTVRHKISKDKVTKALDLGGLALTHPQQAAITSLISSMAGIYCHAHKNPTSIINILENPLRPGRETALFVLNGRNIEEIITNLKNFFPSQEKICYQPPTQDSDQS